MPARIRLQRHGRKHRPFYYIVVADSRAPRDGRYIERIGSYNPMTHPATIQLDFEKALSWLQNGAQPSDTCRSILSREGVLYYDHLVRGVKKGAFDQATADQRFETWKKDKEAKMDAEAQQVKDAADKDLQKRLENERKINEERAQKIAEKNAELNAAAEEAAKAETAEEAPAEAEEEASSEETTEKEA